MKIKIKVCELSNDQITNICRHYFKPCQCNGCPLRRWKDAEQTQELFCFNWVVCAMGTRLYTQVYGKTKFLESLDKNDILLTEIEVNEELLK